MKKAYLLIFCFIFFFTSYSQSKKIYLFNNDLEPITNFELKIHKKDTLKIFKSYYSNFFILNKNVDSLIITYNGFYSQKLDVNLLKIKDTIFLENTVGLDEVMLIGKKEIELGAITKNSKISKISNLGTSEDLIRIEVLEYEHSSIEGISLFLYKSFFHSSYSKKKLSNKNKEFELLLFQSNDSPNEEIVNLLKKPLIVNTADIKKGWFTIDLKSMNIEIKDLKYLFIGYSCLGEPIATGIIKAKHLPNITFYRRSTNSILNKWWEIKASVPAIKIKIKK